MFLNGSVLHTFCFDTCSFTSTATQIEQFRATNFTNAIDINFLDVWRVYRENTFNTYTVRYFAYSKSSVRTYAVYLNNRALVHLNTLFMSLANFIMNADGISGFESGDFIFHYRLFFYKFY